MQINSNGLTDQSSEYPYIWVKYKDGFFIIFKCQTHIIKIKLSHQLD